MNKGDLITAISERADVSKTTTATVFNTMVDLITETLGSGENISVAGFGKMELRHKPARQGVNPHTGEKITIPERNTPKFTFSSTIKNALK